MSHRLLSADAPDGGPAGLGRVAGAARLALAAGFLTFGIWSALPGLGDLTIPAPFALPTAMASLQPAATAITISGRSTVSLALSDADLTRSAQPYFPQTVAGVTVSAPTVRVGSGRIVLNATARSFIGSGPLVATATPYASDGRLMVRMDSVTLSGMPLPDGLRAQVAEQLQAAIDATTGAKMQVSAVTAAQGVLTLKGTTPN